MELNPAKFADELFGGRTPIQSVYLLATFHTHSPLRPALHEIKYNNNPALAQTLGQLMAERYQHQMLEVDALVPVPLHPDKQKQRGYNQSEQIAIGMSRTLNLPVASMLTRTVLNPSQTKLNRRERWDNVSGSFSFNPNVQAARHVLLIDDTLTTGATLEACAQQLLDSGTSLVSIATLGYASG